MDCWQGMDGAVTAVTGFEKGSGKTTFLDLALARLRPAGPVALFSIGLDGAQKSPGGNIRVLPGDVVLSSESLVRASDTRVELLEALPPRAGLGRLLLGRVLRPGSVTLAGCEHLSLLAQLLRRVREEGWAHSLLVDGSVNRWTQVAALGDLGFVFTARVDRANLARIAARMRSLAILDRLPIEPDSQALRWEGPLTAASLESLPRDLEALSLEDATKVFLEARELTRLLARVRLSLRRRLPLRGLVVSLRGLDRADFLDVLGEAASYVVFHPCEAA
ncbi:MAG: uncharacterized protein H6Q00_2997 [Holophagaceae bacterium]|nr:uncharacterized protein [Holophagaceae bacterium]